MLIYYLVSIQKKTPCNPREVKLRQIISESDLIGLNLTSDLFTLHHAVGFHYDPSLFPTAIIPHHSLNIRNYY